MSSPNFFVIFVVFTTTLAYILDSDLFPGYFSWHIRTGHRFLQQIKIKPLANMISDDMDDRPSTSEDADESVAPTSRGDIEDVHSSKRRLCSSEILRMFNLSRLTRELGTREQGVAFAEEHGLILKNKQCRVHRTEMKIDYSINKTVGSFVCYKGKCRTKSRVSRSDGTWFENVKMTMPRIYYLMYAFVHRWSIAMTIWEDFARDEHCLSSATISEWYGYCRETIVTFQSDKQEYIGKIGGPGKIVQIDEIKFGKRKYNRGQQVEGRWVIGMIEDGSEDLRLEMCQENTPTSEVLVPLIQKHVEVGTTIRTGGWGAYDRLADHGFIHKKLEEINDGTHTKKNEIQWWVVKRYFPKEYFNHPENVADIIIEYMWRRAVEQQKKDPFIEFINVIKHVYDPKKKLRIK